MTEYTHPAVEAFLDKSKGEDWYDEHQDLANALTTLLKHISEDGETFAPPAVSTGVLNTDWVLDAGGFDTLQGAIDEAINVGPRFVFVPPGDYNENIVIDDRIHLMAALPGPGGNGGVNIEVDDDSSPAVEITSGSDHLLTNIRVRNNGDGGMLHMNANRATALGCQFVTTGASQVVGSGNGLMVNNCDFVGNDITLESGTSGGIIDSNRRTGTITDNGNNTIGDNG